MNAAVNAFVQFIKEREHIHPLIRQTDLNVILIHQDDKAMLAFKEGEVYLLREEDTSSATIKITGDIPALLKGEGTLRELVRRNQIQIKAPFRLILLLESLFYLGKPIQQLQKII